ncbi:MAG TPA: protein translocase subunit SecF, partial [Amycolatopsis sp.]
TGTLVGVLSSLALATPLLVDFKMRDPQYRQQAERVRARRASQEKKAAAREAGGDDFDAGDDDALEAELRKEKAYAAAASVSARTPKSKPRRGGVSSAKRKR